MGPRTVDIYHINDFHRRLNPCSDGTGGAARLSTVLRTAKEQNPEAIIANVGDVAGDNTAPGPHAFDPLADLFDRMGVDYLGLGNHEFEDPTGGYQSLREGLIAPFGGKVLCANVTETSTGKPLPGTDAYAIHKIAGLNIAFIGVVTRSLASAMFPAAGAGLAVAPMEDTLRELVPQLRAEGADAVVVLGHDSLRKMKDVAGSVDGIDVILAAHDHNTTQRPEFVQAPNGGLTAVAEAGGYGRSVGHIRLEFNPEGKLTGVTGEMLPVTPDITPDQEVLEMLANYEHPERVTEVPTKQWVTLEGGFAELAEHFKESQKP